jgi:hypothetical protein
MKTLPVGGDGADFRLGSGDRHAACLVRCSAFQGTQNLLDEICRFARREHLGDNLTAEDVWHDAEVEARPPRRTSECREAPRPHSIGPDCTRSRSGWRGARVARRSPVWCAAKSRYRWCKTERDPKAAFGL